MPHLDFVIPRGYFDIRRRRGSALLSVDQHGCTGGIGNERDLAGKLLELELERLVAIVTDGERRLEVAVTLGARGDSIVAGEQHVHASECECGATVHRYRRIRRVRDD